MISCDHHDYIESVCTFRYPIKLTMQYGEVIEGIALDTQRDSNKDEYIKITSQGVERLIFLDEIVTLEVCVDNPHFMKVSFK